jgi:hypothetical protein
MLNIVYGESITDDEFEFEENNILDERESMFSNVVLNPSNLQVWLEFISKTGQDQDDFLDHLEYKKNRGSENARKNRLNQSLGSDESSESDFENGKGDFCIEIIFI